MIISYSKVIKLLFTAFKKFYSLLFTLSLVLSELIFKKTWESNSVCFFPYGKWLFQHHFLKSSSFPQWSITLTVFINQLSLCGGVGESVDGFCSDSLVKLSNLVAVPYNPEYYHFRKRSWYLRTIPPPPSTSTNFSSLEYLGYS